MMEKNEVMDIETVQMLLDILKDTRTEWLVELERVDKTNKEDLFAQGYSEGLKDGIDMMINGFEKIPSQVEEMLK